MTSRNLAYSRVSLAETTSLRGDGSSKGHIFENGSASTFLSGKREREREREIARSRKTWKICSFVKSSNVQRGKRRDPQRGRGNDESRRTWTLIPVLGCGTDVARCNNARRDMTCTGVHTVSAILIGLLGIT